MWKWNVAIDLLLYLVPFIIVAGFASFIIATIFKGKYKKEL